LKNSVRPKTSIQKTAKFEAKDPNLGKIYGQIEILSNHDLICQKFAAF